MGFGLSVIIITRDRPRELVHLLENLSSIEKVSGFLEIIVVDSSNETVFNENRKQVHSFFPSAYHCKSSPNLGKQRNYGASLASGDILFFFDDDIELSKDYFLSIIRAFNDERTLAVTGYVVNQKDLCRFEKLLRKFFLLSDIRNSKTFRKISGFYSFPFHCSSDMEIKAIWGCNMAIKANYFQKELFDESLRMYEDVDFSFRLGKRGQLKLVRKAELIHYRSPKNRLPPQKLLAYQASSIAHMISKYERHNLVRWICFLWALLGLVILFQFGYAFDVDITSGTYLDPKKINWGDKLNE